MLALALGVVELLKVGGLRLCTWATVGGGLSPPTASNFQPTPGTCLWGGTQDQEEASPTCRGSAAC